MAKLALDGNSKPIQALRPASTQTVSVATASAQSAAVSAGCRIVRICSDTDCYYTLDSATATSGDVLLPAGLVEYIHVFGGDQIAFIRYATDGTAHITEMY